MSSIFQIYGIVNDVAKQTFGEESIQAVDTASFISLGDKVLSSETDTENYLNTLVDRIGRTVFSVRRYEGQEGGMVRHPFEYGCIVQKIYVDLPEAAPNNAWEIGKDNYSPVYAPVIKPSVKQKLFDKISTWEIDVTIPDFMLRTAFQNERQMATFIDAIFTAMDNMMTLALENQANLTRANFIARKINGGKDCGAINLLSQYNALVGAGNAIDRATAMRSTDFLKWASMQISLWVNRMRKMSSLFNEEGYRRHTPREDVVVNVLQDFASATESFLQADTYHRELVALPRYESVPYWQGSGETYSFDDTSKIDVKIGKTAGGDDIIVNQSGVIAVIYDYQAMGVTMTERRSSTERNNKDEYTNYYNKANFGYFNDMSENGIVFYLDDGGQPGPGPEPGSTKIGAFSPNGTDQWEHHYTLTYDSTESDPLITLLHAGKGNTEDGFSVINLVDGGTYADANVLELNHISYTIVNGGVLQITCADRTTIENNTISIAWIDPTTGDLYSAEIEFQPQE